MTLSSRTSLYKRNYPGVLQRKDMSDSLSFALSSSLDQDPTNRKSFQEILEVLRAGGNLKMNEEDDDDEEEHIPG